MKKIYLLEVDQHGIKRYVGKAPAKDLVKLATSAELNATQDAQRPIDKKRLEEISQFVANSDGTLSTSIVIGTTNNNLNVHQVEIDGIKDLYYMDFPETDDEFEAFKDSFDIMDGQHRLFSFGKDFIKISDDDNFEITFEMYLKPTMKERRMIFKNTNEKQEKVPSNLLMWFREKLNLLNEKEKIYHPVVSSLNTETKSPLKGRIIMGAEKITGGFKAQQVITILDKSNINNIGGTELDADKMFNLISNYLCGWEKAVGSKIADRDNNVAPFSKVAGFRFMIILLPTFYEEAKKDRKKFDENYVSSLIKKVCGEQGISPSDIFDANSDYRKNDAKGNVFGGETPITMYAKVWENNIKSMSSGSFDPLA